MIQSVYFDASGWTTKEEVLEIFNAQGLSYTWMDEVDSGADVFNVDFELVKGAVISLAPEDSMLETSTFMYGMNSAILT